MRAGAMRTCAVNHRVRMFALEYLKNGGKPTEAARAAGYVDNPRDWGRELLKHDWVRAQIDLHLEKAAISADETLARMADQACGDITEISDCFYESDEGMYGKVRKLDLAKVKAKGLGHMVKSVTPTRHGDRVEMYDAHQALVQLGKYHKLWVERIEARTDLNWDEMTTEQLRAIVEGKGLPNAAPPAPRQLPGTIIDVDPIPEGA